jgi:hypothetical protein
LAKLCTHFSYSPMLSPCPTHLILLHLVTLTNIWWWCTNYELPQYATVSSVLVPRQSRVQIFASAVCSDVVLSFLSEWETRFHNRATQQLKFYFPFVLCISVGGGKTN